MKAALDGLVSILDGNTFVVSDRRGDIDVGTGDPRGYFDRDTRFLSRWLLTINGQSPAVLSVDHATCQTVQFILAPSSDTAHADSSLSVVRKRSVGGGFHEDITLVNHASDLAEVDIRIEAAADFADLFEVRDAVSKNRDSHSRVEDRCLSFEYRRERFVCETRISCGVTAELDEHGLRFRVRLEPQGSWTTCLDVEGSTNNVRRTCCGGGHRPTVGAGAAAESNTDRWLARAPTLSSPWDGLRRVYRRGLVDLAALRFESGVLPGALPAAGLPWFMTILGRDSILTAFQALPFQPELARTTLSNLALLQGTTVDEFRDEEPGKILHELRLGEMTAFEERPQSPYYGSADSTPLFLILLDEYERWSGDKELVRELERHARSALAWIDQYGDFDGDGYVEYERRNEQSGLQNQCWKDSWNSIAFADGELAPLPHATCEIQGYVYDAKVRSARMAREIWRDRPLADRLQREANELKRSFNRDFWVPEHGYYALALDRDKQQVDSLTSNMGHLLWSGIVDQSKVASVVRHLLGQRLFSGWGVRTMAEGEGRYNPIGYHVGTVWPHDNSFIALGLQRYGYAREAARIALGILDAAVFFDGRLPEAFAGYDRDLTHDPVEYPAACRPQALASGAPLLLLRVLLGLDAVGEQLLVAPALPRRIESIELLGLPGRWGSADAFARGVVDEEDDDDQGTRRPAQVDVRHSNLRLVRPCARSCT